MATLVVVEDTNREPQEDTGNSIQVEAMLKPPLVPRRKKEPKEVTWERVKPESKDSSPHAVAQASGVCKVDGRFTFKMLFDSGATMNMVKRSALPKNVKPRSILSGAGTQTTNGVVKPTECVILSMLMFAEFSPNRHIRSVTCFVHDQPNLRYDLTLGRTTLANVGIKIDFKDTKLLQRFVSERGKIVPSRITAVSTKKQRELARAIKRARFLALLPYVSE